MLYEYEVEKCAGYDPVDFDSVLEDLAVLQTTMDMEVKRDYRSDHVVDLDEGQTASESEEEVESESRKSIKQINKRRRNSSKDVKTRKSSKRDNVKVSRFFVQDIRKCYTKMLQNVMNSGDFTLLYGFLETFFGPNPQHTTTKYLRGSPDKVFTMTFYGLDEVAKYWYCFMNMSPDNILILSDATVQHTTGQLMSSMHKQSTHIYEDPPAVSSYYAPYIWVDEKYNKEHRFVRDVSTNEIMVGKTCRCETHDAHTEQEQLQHHQDVNIAQLESKRATMCEIMRSVENVMSHLPLRNPPEAVRADGTLIISTDVNRMISRMDLSIIY